MRAELHSGGLPALEAEWSALWQPGQSPFASAPWAAAWWRHYGEGAQPHTVVVHDGGEVAGIAPLAVRRRGPVRVLVTVGEGPSDLWDVLARPDARPAVLEAIAGFLRRAGGWDVALLRYLPPDGGLGEALDAAGVRVGVRRPVPAPAIELPASFDDYLATLSSSRRQNLRRHLRRLDGGEVELRSLERPEELAAALDRWQRFREAQWTAQEKEIDPEHLSGRFRAFVEDAVEGLLPAGQAMVWEFLREGEVVGVYVNFCDDRAYHWYLGGFAPEVASLGLGKIAIGHGIRTSIQAGRRRYDFGRGAEPYKYWYGAEDRQLDGLVAGTGGVRSRAALAAARAAARRRAA